MIMYRIQKLIFILLRFVASNESSYHDSFFCFGQINVSRSTAKASTIVVEFQTQYLMTPNVGIYFDLKRSRESIATHCIRLKLSAKDIPWKCTRLSLLIPLLPLHQLHR